MENYELILDDEKYFTFYENIYPGNDRYYANDKEIGPESV